jgi:hypothetical protein
MSVTFSIDGIEQETGHDLPCPDCGTTLATGGGPDDCSCYGYGGPERLPFATFELNVANENAIALLRFLGLPDEYCGSVDATDLLGRLSIKRASVDLLVEPGSVDGRVISVGRNRAQVERYLDRIERIATQAQKYARNVVWC